MNINELPSQYNEKIILNLRKNKSLALAGTLLAVVTAIVMFVLGYFVSPPFFEGGSINTIRVNSFILIAILAVMFSLLYIMIYMGIEGLVVKRAGAKAKYGIKGIYVYVSSSKYFDKKTYLLFCLLPVLCTGLLIALICCVVPAVFFWALYFVEAANLIKGATILPLIFRLSKMPDDIYIRCYGLTTAVFKTRS